MTFNAILNDLLDIGSNGALILSDRAGHRPDRLVGQGAQLNGRSSKASSRMGRRPDPGRGGRQVTLTGFSIGSNDLTQLVLGIDRDSQRLASLFDERNPAVVRLISDLIEIAHKHGRVVGLYGQAPSDHPNFARLLVDLGIDSISVTPDSYVAVRQAVAEAEAATCRPLGHGKDGT